MSADAIARGVAFLASAQLPSGEIPVETVTSADMIGASTADPSVFPTALAISCLSHLPAAAAIVERAQDFLRAEMDRSGLWRHWPLAHLHHRQLPPDVDDSACAAAATGTDNRELLLANRRSDGLFLTWIIPRPWWRGMPHLRATLPQLRHLPTQVLFFRHTSARLNDVDAVVNANALFCLGQFPGREPVVEHLLAILRDRRESQCDKWYQDPFTVWYFFARAIGGRDDARAMIVERLVAARRSSSLHAALAISALHGCGRPPDQADIAMLLDTQRSSGEWPRAALYHGGRTRGRASFETPHPDTPHWGSEALTTAFALEALSKAAAR